MMDAFQPVGDLPKRVNWRGAVVVAKDAHGRWLMQLRDDFEDVAAPGLWSFFGGAVEPGEELIEAAQREFLEETGINLDISSLSPLARFASIWRDDGVLYAFKTSTIVDVADIRLGEGAGFACFTEDQISGLSIISPMGDLIGMTKLTNPATD